MGMTILERTGQKGAQSALFARDSGELADELELALRLGQVEIRFQPIYSCVTGRIVSAEALARWQHAVFGEIGAQALFDLAAKAGLREKLAEHLVSLAIRQAANWPEGLGLSLNIPARQLLGGGLISQLSADLAAAGINPQLVTLEITEELLLDDLDLAARRIAPLRELGVRIALDDFGAGFCNFDYLKRLPLDALKLDRSMVQGIAASERDRAVLRAIVTLAKVLELEVVAEGIEHADQRDVVIGEGCASWQGFLGSPPVRHDELVEQLAV
ncbi:EAL domain-containing protein [Altererythrobacter sp. BO-6]|nr:EAL domain-containing protein [Altererythrobacter sp. BO-6]